MSNRTCIIGLVAIFSFLVFYLMARAEGNKASQNILWDEVK